MKIAVDVDGVILNSIQLFIRHYNQTHKTHYTKDDITQWDFFEDWNMSEKEFYSTFYMLYENEEAPPLIDDHIPEYLRKLNSTHKVDIVSARNPRFKRSLQQKLKKEGICQKEQYNNLIVVNEKPHNLKITLNYDIYIDDNLNLIPFLVAYPQKTLLLFHQPWNAHILLQSRNIIRVHNWLEVISYIKYL